MKRSPTLVLSTQNWSILAKFAKKNPAKLAVFYWLFLGKVSPRNFPWNRPIFLRSCPWKSFENWLFCAKIPRNRPIHSANFDFFLLKSREIGQFFREFAPENPAKFCFFFREISEALIKASLWLNASTPHLHPHSHPHPLFDIKIYVLSAWTFQKNNYVKFMVTGRVNKWL